MKPVELDLGSLEMKSTTSDVRLRLSSHAAFAPSAEDDVAALVERLTASGSNSHSMSRPWITCDNVFQLMMCLSLDDVLTAAAQVEMIDTLVDRLRIAKLWRQLGMTAISVEATSANENYHDIKIELAIRQGDSRSSPRQLHKLTIPPPLDTRPPPGVCSAALREVRHTVYIQRGETPKRRKPKRQRIVKDTQASQSSNVFAQGSSVDERRPCASPEGVESHPTTTSTEIPAVSEPRWVLESDDEESADPDDELLLGFDVATESLVDLDAPVKAPFLLKRNSSGLDLDFKEPTADNNDVMELLDAAIRMTISDCRRILPKTMSLTGTESLRRLDTLVPSIWRPDYSLAVGSRAVFLPTIFHALDSVHFQDFKQQRCRSGFASSNSDHSQDVAKEQRKRKSKAPPATVPVQIWHKVQTTAYQRTKTKKLKSLCFSSRPLASNSEPPAEIPNSMEVDFFASSLYSDDEALSDLFDGDDHDNDSIFSDSQSDMDLFESEELEAFDIATNGLEGLKSMADADTINIACSGELKVIREVEHDDNDMLSICDSLGSSSLSEHCFEALDPLNRSTENLCDLEDIRI